MAVDEPRVIDFIGVDNSSEEVVLTISDHLDWSDTRRHLQVLEEKLNAYLAFVESGELIERYADSKGRAVAISVVFKFNPNEFGLVFLAKASKVVGSAGVRLQYKSLPGSYVN